MVAGATPERLPVVLLPCTLAGYVPAGSRARRRATARHPHNNAGSYDGDLAGALRGADVFIGVSAPDILTGDDVAAMAADAIVFALANPVPEVDPDAAGEHAAVVATGRSDYPNQINNVLAFPGVFRGLLDAQSRTITDDMLVAAARALAGVVSPAELGPHYIIPSVFHPDVASAVAAAVRDAAGGRPSRS